MRDKWAGYEDQQYKAFNQCLDQGNWALFNVFQVQIGVEAD